MGLLKTEEAGIDACAIARDMQVFDLLIEDMEAELGERWGGLNFSDGLAYDLTPVALHQLLHLGADDFTPYPLPEGALHEAIERVCKPQTPTLVQSGGTQAAPRKGIILPVSGLAGGVGSTTFAVNLAYEIALHSAKSGLKVCLIDLDLQAGSVSTYLDLPRREAIFEMLSDTASMDRESFQQALLSFNDKLDILTAPADALPLEILVTEDVDRLLDMATSLYDFVIIDMPKTLIQWTETVLTRADVFFAILEMDMRSAQNTLRFVRTLKAEDLPLEKVRFALNYAPKFTDINGRSRSKRLAENLDINLELMLPDGGKHVLEACDHGLPLAESAARNPLRKELVKLSKSIFELVTAQAKARGGV